MRYTRLFSRYSLDRALMYRVKDGCSFVDFKGRTPRRCLDLGTGVCLILHQQTAGTDLIGASWEIG